MALSDVQSIHHQLKILGRQAIGDLFSISTAHAQMPPTEAPLSGTLSIHGTLIPTGYVWSQACYEPNPPYEALYNNSKTNYFEMYRRVNATWKGCVEARNAPYDVTDEAPTSQNPNTQFWSAFWPSDTSSNDWIPYDHNYPAGWSGMDPVYSHTSFKYNSTAPKTIDETPPNTKGPNKGCPDPILPLTGSRSTFDTYIDGISHWDSGGTVISEGVGWGWRVLSPGPPFTEGAAYSPNNRKILIVMSDGQNEIMSAANSWASQYTAYGAMYWNWRFPRPWTFDNARVFFDNKTIAACDNAKAAGIEIYMVIFRQADFQARDLFQRCASDQTHMIEADNPAQLEGAFEKIATSVLSKVRLTR
jgi:hypothetical protein